MSAYNLNSGYGQLLAMQIAAAVGPCFGKILVVAEDSDGTNTNTPLSQMFVPDPDGRVRFFRTLEAAYDAAVTNSDDVILLTGHNYHDLAAGIAWTKNRIHVIGMDGGGRMLQQGARVRLPTGIATAYVLKNTGNRNTFRNIKFIQESGEATALTVLQDGSEGSLYENCSFVFSVSTNLNSTSAHEVIAGSDSATFRNCTFGNDTLLTSAARSVFHVDQVTTSQEFKSNQIIDCTFSISSSSGTATFVRLDAVGDILFSNLFKRCSFVASVDSAGGAAIAEAVQTGTGTVKGCIALDNCGFFNCTKVSTATGGRNEAIQVVGPVPTALSCIGIKPAAA
jgi:hypothetical protein